VNLAARRRLDEAGAAIVVGVERTLPAWVEAQVARILDAYGRAHPAANLRARVAAVEAGTAATARVASFLRALFALDPADQRATPLEIVRTAYREPTAILRAAGVPPVEREAFDERAWPDDDYGLVPRTLGDLGDGDLAPLQLVWGMAKATALRRAARRGSPAKD
jgi:hypothetical protein